MKTRWIRYLLLSFALFLLVGFMAIFFFSEKIFNDYFDKYLAKINARTNAVINVNFKKYTFPNSVEIAGISVVDNKGDTLIKVDSLLFNVKLISILKNDPAPSNLTAENIFINIVHTDSLKNYKIFKDDSVRKDTLPGEKTGYNYYVNQLFNIAFNKVPPKLDVKDIMIYFTGNYGKMIISVPHAKIHDNMFSSDAVLSDSKSMVKWNVSGKIISSKKEIIADIKQMDEGMNAFTGVLLNVEMLTGFDTLHVRLNNIDKLKDKTGFSLEGSGSGMQVYQYRLANDTVNVPYAEFNFNITVKGRELFVDVPSRFRLNEIPGEIYINANNRKPKRYFLKLTTEKISSQTFFNSLPKGMFTNLEGIETTGDILFSTQIGYNFANPDTAIFSSILQTKNFKITKMGEANLRMMNGEFTHNVYEKGKVVRSFVVGPENPYYTPIEFISPFLKNSILTAEDGNFYSHNGFNENAFRESIIENMQKGRFARGGSTITMQLVKNVYLRRDKVISRKLEEALIVWLIESQNLVSKERMFEVYLNIIEWGPGIYGIGEASQFYFSKHPSQLNLAESIFLSSIVPRPKLFRYSFDEYGNLRGYLEGYYRLLAGIMLRRGQILQMEYDSLTPHIVLQGPARDLVLPPDSLYEDPWLEFEDKTDTE